MSFNRRGMPAGQSGPSATFMPPHILHLFRPSEPLPYLPPCEPAPEPAPSSLSGVAQLTAAFERGPAPAVVHMETPEQRRAARRADRAARHEAQLGGLAAGWDPKRNPAATADAYKTLFVARLAYETTERRLLKEFEVFGPIQSVRLVKDQAGLSRGYAFIEYKDGEDLKRAYRRGDGLRIDGRRVLVDVERARTVRGWLPRRLGGGLGDTRKAKERKKSEKRSGQSWVNPPIGAFHWWGPVTVESKRQRAEERAAAAAASAEAAARAAAGGGSGGAGAGGGGGPARFY